MKYILTLLLIISCALTSLSQNAIELDMKNGFNKFHFGQTIAEVKKIGKITYEGKDVDINDLKYYSVKDISTYKIFEYPLEKIGLIFYKDVLYSIAVSPLFKYSKEENDIIYQDIFSRIQDQYGPFKEVEITAIDKLSKIEHKYERYGKQVLLRFSSGIDTYQFFDIEIRKEVLKEEKSGL